MHQSLRPSIMGRMRLRPTAGIHATASTASTACAREFQEGAAQGTVQGGSFTPAPTASTACARAVGDSTRRDTTREVEEREGGGREGGIHATTSAASAACEAGTGRVFHPPLPP